MAVGHGDGDDAEEGLASVSGLPAGEHAYEREYVHTYIPTYTHRRVHVCIERVLPWSCRYVYVQ